MAELTEEQKKAAAKAEAKDKAKAEAHDKAVEEAKAELAAEAQEKADKSAAAAAKAKADAEAAERAAKTPEQRLLDDWESKHTVLAPYITQLGRVRGGLNLPDQAEAKRILKSYGFRV